MNNRSGPLLRTATSSFLRSSGFFLTDQMAEEQGNLWVWPGSHRRTAAYLRKHGPDSLSAAAPYPPIDLPDPCPVVGRAGDLLLAHYLLGHNMSGNLSATMREVVYFRLRRRDHRERWRDIVQDPFLEFAPLAAFASQEPV
jgi:ectoine hydroxylase-related dioxygenase (phytanoyl-CoA dioxygenase family)